MTNRIGVYAGSFDPPTMGHLDVFQRTHKLFDKYYLVVAKNIGKNAVFSPEERAELLKASVKEVAPGATDIEVCVHRGLIVEFCNKVGAKTLVRGLRAISDFEKEFQIATMNRRLAPKVDTLHMMTDEKYFFVSSTLIKEVASLGGALKDIVPSCVAEALKEKYKS